MKLINVTIEPSGRVSMEVEGAVGEQCKALTAPLERVLGGKTTSTPKPELYQEQANPQQAGR